MDWSKIGNPSRCMIGDGAVIVRVVLLVRECMMVILFMLGFLHERKKIEE